MRPERGRWTSGCRRHGSAIRTCFVRESQHFEVDRFLAPTSDLVLLEAELDCADQTVRLPPFLDFAREVSGEIEFSNAQIARAGM